MAASVHWLTLSASRSGRVIFSLVAVAMVGVIGAACANSASTMTAGAVDDAQCARISDALHYAKIGGSGLDSATMAEYGEAVAWVTDGCLDSAKLGEVQSLLAKIKPLGTAIPHPEAPRIVTIHRSG